MGDHLDVLNVISGNRIGFFALVRIQSNDNDELLFQFKQQFVFHISLFAR